MVSSGGGFSIDLEGGLKRGKIIATRVANRILGAVAEVGRKCAKWDANSASMLGYHQPKVLRELKK